MKTFLIAILVMPFLTACALQDLPLYIADWADKVGGWMAFSAIIGGVIDMIRRLIPSVNPTSILLDISKFLKSIAKLAEKLSAFLDSLGLQVLKQAPEEKK